MVTSSNTTAGSVIDIGINDLGPLAWVLDEMRKSLDSATKALRRYVRDAELAKGSDLNAADASQLRIARQQLHQSVGALEMVGFAAPASMLRGMEAAVQKFVAKPELCTDAAASKVERASFALLGYLEALLIGKKPSAIELFSQYADVQELAGASRVHPADLWTQAWQWRDVRDTCAAQHALDAEFRAAFDRSALAVVKTADMAACAELAQLSAGLANQTAAQVDAHFRIFWRIAAGMLQAVATGSITADLYIKRSVSRLLIQLATHIKGDLSVPDRLAQDLLFFCAQATPKGQTPLLDEVRAAYDLAQHVPIDYSKSFYGQFDPSLLVQARKRIGQLKETWSAFTAGEISKAKPMQDQMSLLIDSISRLLPTTCTNLVTAFNEVVDSTARLQKPPEPALGMEVATAILYLEASFEDFDPKDQQQANRLDHLAGRVRMARGGAEGQPLESWMEDLYRRVSDRQTMGSVVGELKLILSELEKMMDAYFRDPQDKVLLSSVPSKFTQMRGVLTILGLEQAVLAVSRMRDSVEQILVTEFDTSSAKAASTFERMGNNLGALGFLIDMLSYQPVLAKKLFVYDEEASELRPLMGRTLPDKNQQPSAPIPNANSNAAASFDAQATQPLGASAPMATSTPAAPVIVDASEVDPELLEIFLEEAREVVENGLKATQALIHEPNNIGEMTTLRRAFHTLKGSSRMVGLNVFGEAAWSMEQVMNAWLADQKHATLELCELSTQALNAHTIWIEDIAKGGGKDRTAEPFRTSANALRLQGQFVPIRFLPVAAQNTEAAQQASSPAQLAADEAHLQTQPFEKISLPDLPDLPSLSAGIALSAASAQAEIPAKRVEQPESSGLDVSTLGFVVNEKSSSLQANGEPAAQLVDNPAEVFDFNAFENQQSVGTPALSDVSAEQDALITAEELLAFEQAMMMDEAQAQSTLQVEPMPALAAQVLAPNLLEVNSIDLQALEKISGSAGISSGSGLKSTVMQTWSSSEQESHPERIDFSQTLPANFEHDTQPSELGELGINLSDVPAASYSQTAWVRHDAVAHEAQAFSTQGLASTAPKAQQFAFTPSSPANRDAGSSASYAPEEQFKAIGPLRVSLPLYNVYLNEADEWSRRLVNSLAEWALESDATVPNDAVAFAHSLAGSSATVGFSALSGLARSLENTLVHMQRIEEDADYDSHAHASVFLSAADEIRHLLHQFAAGILKSSAPQIEADLAHCMQAPFNATAQASLTADSALNQLFIDGNQASDGVNSQYNAIDSIALNPLKEGSHTASAAEPESEQNNEPVIAIVTAQAFDSRDAAPEPQAQRLESEMAFDIPMQAVVPAVALQSSSVVTEASFSNSLMASLTDAPLLAVRSRQIDQDQIDDEIDVQDALDPDLFEIFEEEAQELFPATAAALRQWTAHPDNMGARGEVLRGLHTLKGSARLAGAMRLGELAHRMESSVDNIPHEGASSADIEPLMAQLDGMQHNFDVLRNPALVSEATPSAAVAVAAAVTPTALSTAAAPSPAPVPAAAPAQLEAAAGLAPLQPLAAAAGMIAPSAMRTAPGQTVRVRALLLDRLMNQAGEVMITRARLEAELSQLRGSLTDLGGNLEKLRSQLRELDVQAESQMQTRLQQSKETEAAFDPLEFDRYTRVQELTRMMAESVNDVATVQRNIQRTIESTEDDLVMQARQTRDLQRDLLRTRMVEFEGISERLYRVVRQASKDAGKQVKLDILGGTIEMDRGVLDRMTPAFEHLLRNCVAHGIETAQVRTAAGKAASGEIVITLHQEGNDVSIEFRDDGAGLNIARIREKAISQGLLGQDATLEDKEAANLIFTPGFSTAASVTELSGRGVGMDVVRSEVVALGGRIETSTSAGQGTSFKLVLPLTTAVTQVVMMRIGELAIGVPANLTEIVRRASLKELQSAYNSGSYDYAGESLPFFWAGALLQHSSASSEPATKTMPVAVFRSAAQRVAVHIDEVLGNQEVVVKNLGPQLSRLPGLAGMTVLASGAVALIYNPVALATVYGAQARAMSFDPAQPHALEGQAQFKNVSDAVSRELSGDAQPVIPLVSAHPASISAPAVPLVLVVDDSITVRRVTQRLLQREGYRVSMAADGLQALERLAEELPSVILSDIEMPRMDGFDLLRNVRGDAKLKHLPTIMITSRIAEKHREYAFELGANHYLGKPYNEEELLSLIRRYAREEATV
jgi:chemosensory pili system protein ChpA (sensor histidine kinase/response regulator)